MNGKVIKLNDYKFNFGQETIFLNVFAVFKNIKNGNKYIIYIVVRLLLKIMRLLL